MQIAVGAGHAKLAVGDAAQAVGDGRHAGGELAAVADDHAIARQAIGVFGEVFLQPLAADFLFALDEELEVQRQTALDGDPGLDALQVREQLALVVGGAAGVELAVAAGGLERGRGPFFQRIGRLHVVVAVDQGRGGAGHRRRLGVDQRMAGGRDHFGRQTASGGTGRPPTRPPDACRRGVRVGADARNAEELAQLVLEPCGVGIQILVDGGHGIHREVDGGRVGLGRKAP